MIQNVIKHTFAVAAISAFLLACPARAGSSGQITAVLTDIQRVGEFVACDNIQEIQLTIEWFEEKSHQAITSAIGEDAVAICRQLSGVSPPVWVTIQGNIITDNGMVPSMRSHSTKRFIILFLLVTAFLVTISLQLSF